MVHKDGGQTMTLRVHIILCTMDVFLYKVEMLQKCKVMRAKYV